MLVYGDLAAFDAGGWVTGAGIRDARVLAGRRSGDRPAALRGDDGDAERARAGGDAGAWICAGTRASVERGRRVQRTVGPGRRAADLSGGDHGGDVRGRGQPPDAGQRYWSAVMAGVFLLHPGRVCRGDHGIRGPCAADGDGERRGGGPAGRLRQFHGGGAGRCGVSRGGGDHLCGHGLGRDGVSVWGAPCGGSWPGGWCRR